MTLWIPFVVVCIAGQPDTCEGYQWRQMTTTDRAACQAIARTMIPTIAGRFMLRHPKSPTEAFASCREWKGEAA